MRDITCQEIQRLNANIAAPIRMQYRTFREKSEGFTGVVLLAVVFGPLGAVEHWWERLLFGLIGVGLIGFDSLLTVTVDHRLGTLNLHYRSLFRVSSKAYPFSEICSVDVAEDS